MHLVRVTTFTDDSHLLLDKKQHRNGIKKPKKLKYPSLKGVIILRQSLLHVIVLHSNFFPAYIGVLISAVSSLVIAKARPSGNRPLPTENLV